MKSLCWEKRGQGHFGDWAMREAGNAGGGAALVCVWVRACVRVRAYVCVRARAF